MNFFQAVRSGFANSTNFHGRASRSEFWYWALFTFLLKIAAFFVDGPKPLGPFGLFTGLLLIVPGCSVLTRRLHDIGKSGWWQTVWVIGPFLFYVITRMHNFGNPPPPAIMDIMSIGIIPIFYWAYQKGVPGGNVYGAEPIR